MSSALEEAIVAKVHRGDVRIPAYPPAAGKLARVLQKPNFTIDDVVKVLRSDEVLAATALRLANSAYYSRGQTATTLSTAAVRIGSNQLHRLAVAAGTQRVFSSPGPLAALRRRAWRQSLMSAAICECLATQAQQPAEDSFVAGLLHDIGRVLAIAVIEEVGNGIAEEEAWKLVERFHVELGMVIAARWMLPAAIEEVIADHHVRDALPAEAVLRRVQAADQVVQLLEAEPSVTPERLGAIGVLSTRECKALSDMIPTMPEFIEAFGINQPADVAAVAAAASSAQRVPSDAIAVELHSVGPSPIFGALTGGGPQSLSVAVAVPGRVNWLVQVKVEGLSFWANVKGSKATEVGHEWDLKPFALTPELAHRWVALTEGFAKAA